MKFAGLSLLCISFALFCSRRETPPVQRNIESRDGPLPQIAPDIQERLDLCMSGDIRKLNDTFAHRLPADQIAKFGSNFNFIDRLFVNSGQRVLQVTSSGVHFEADTKDYRESMEGRFADGRLVFLAQTFRSNLPPDPNFKPRSEPIQKSIRYIYAFFFLDDLAPDYRSYSWGSTNPDATGYPGVISEYVQKHCLHFSAQPSSFVTIIVTDEVVGTYIPVSPEQAQRIISQLHPF